MQVRIRHVTPIAIALRAERDARGWNQRRAAQHFDVSQAQYQRWETKGEEPGGKYYSALASFLGLDKAAAAELVLRDRLARQDVPFEEAEDWTARAEREIQ